MVYKIEIKVLASIILFSIIIPSSFTLSQEAQVKDYYNEGQAAAKKDFSGNGAFIGGLISGSLSPFVGYPVGALVVWGKETSIPNLYLSEFDDQQARSFEKGYKDYVKKKRCRSFAIGGGIPFLLWWNLMNQQ